MARTPLRRPALKNQWKVRVMLDPQTLFERNPAVMAADVGEDVVALLAERGACVGMEKVTADVWRLLEEPSNLHRLCAALTDQYEVDAQTCRDDLGELLAEMVRAGLIIPRAGLPSA